MVGDTLNVGVGVFDGDGLGELDAKGDALGVGVVDALIPVGLSFRPKLKSNSPWGLMVPDVGVGVGEAVREGVTECVGVFVGVVVGVRVGVCVGVCVGVTVFVGVAVGDVGTPQYEIRMNPGAPAPPERFVAPSLGPFHPPPPAPP